MSTDNVDLCIDNLIDRAKSLLTRDALDTFMANLELCKGDPHFRQTMVTLHQKAMTIDNHEMERQRLEQKLVKSDVTKDELVPRLEAAHRESLSFGLHDL